MYLGKEGLCFEGFRVRNRVPVNVQTTTSMDKRIRMGQKGLKGEQITTQFFGVSCSTLGQDGQTSSG